MLAAEPYMIVFRFLHILGGVIWVGSTFLLTLFIGPSAAELGPDAGPMLHKLVVEKRVTQVITSIAIVTVSAGLFVYWHDWQQARSFADFVGTDFGLALSIGAAFGIAAAIWGSTKVGAKIEQMVRYADGAMPAEGPPPPEVIAELDRHGAQLKTNSIIDLALQVGAVIMMSTARYW